MTLTVQLLFGIVLVVFLISGVRDRKKVKDERTFFYGEKLNWISFALNAFGTNFSFISASFVLVFWSYQSDCARCFGPWAPECGDSLIFPAVHGAFDSEQYI